MPTVKITKRMVDAAVADRADTFFWDQNLAGFGLKVTTAGTKTYLIQYRMGGRGARTRRYSIGRDGTWTPATARAEAEKLLRQVASGVDPQAASKERNRIEEELAFPRYAEIFLSEYGKRKWRPRTFASAESNMRRWIIPVLSNKALPSITRRDLNDVLDRVPTSQPALARSLFALMRKLFNWAVERGDLDLSPMKSMKGPPTVASRDRVLSDEELFFITACATDLAAPFGQLISFLIITGQRRSEVAGMRWGELDRELREWTIPATRSKNGHAQTVPLSQMAMNVLDYLAGRERWPRSGLVFSTTGDTPVSGFSKVKARLDRIVAEAMRRPIPPWRLHDIRRTFATNMQRLGVRLEVTEALLNHVSGSRSGIVGVYQQHDWKPEKLAAIASWDERLSTLLFEDGLGRFTDWNERGAMKKGAQAKQTVI